MAGCDGWISIKILELLFASFCMIYKRVTDDEANKLFFFLQKYSREWPLLNNVTWEENGAIFTDIVYGGYIIIIIGMIVGQCAGELQRCRKLENFFLIVGALLFIAAGSLELAALESVEERLVDNAAILGVFSLVTGFIFIIDLLSASKRRKKEKFRMIQKTTKTKLTQTEEKNLGDIIKANDMNGNVQNGRPFSMEGNTRIPRNAVKILPSSPTANDLGIPATDFAAEPPVIEGSELKTHEGRIRSTESFLRSEKGLYPKYRKTSEPDGIIIPTGYVLVPADQFQGKIKPKSDSGIGDSPTPPGYAKIVTEGKTKPNYVIIPIDQDKRKENSRKLKSPNPVLREMYYVDGRVKSSPNLNRNAYSDGSDLEDDRFKYGNRSRKHKLNPEYFEMESKGRKYAVHSEDSSDEPKLSYQSELYRPDSRHSLRSSREWRYYPKGKVNEGYTDDPMSRRSSPYRSRTSSPDKPKSILRFDQGRLSKRENGLYFPKDIRQDSLDSQKIAEDLRNLREVTKSELDLTRNLEKENKVLKERLRQEKEEKEKLKYDLEDRKRMEEIEDEKNRRMSEREEQYFGIKDLKQSHNGIPKTKHFLERESEKVGRGAKEVNERLKEKHLEHESKVQEYRDLIDERFKFLNEEEKRKPGKSIPEVKSASDMTERSFPKTRKSESDDTNITPSTDEEIRLRVETPGSASYKSEALFWLGDKEEPKTPTPSSPSNPGYVLYTAQNWPESPSPEDRFQFSAKEAQNLSIKSEDQKSSQKQKLLEFEEVPDTGSKPSVMKKSLLVRKVDFPNEPVVEIKKPTTVAGSTSTWKKWLQPKPKLQHARSMPN